MRTKFEFCTKMVFCFSFIVNCAKPDAPIKGPKLVFNIHDIETYRPLKMRMRRDLEMNKATFIYKYKLSQKRSAYAKHIKLLLDLKVKFLENRIVGLWQTDIYAIILFCSNSKPFEHCTDALTT